MENNNQTDDLITIRQSELDTIIDYVAQLENNIAHLKEQCLILETQKRIAQVKLNSVEMGYRHING
jgi:phage shock protein A